MVAQDSNSCSFTEMCSDPKEMIKEYPISSLMVIFGAGLGVGLILTQTLSEPISRAVYGNPTMTDRISKQLHDVIAQMIPESVARHMHS